VHLYPDRLITARHSYASAVLGVLILFIYHVRFVPKPNNALQIF